MCWPHSLPALVFISFFNSQRLLEPIIPASKVRRLPDWSDEFYWRYSPFLGRGRGATSGSAAPGKSLSVSRYWEKLRRSISPWCDHLRSSQERSSRWLLAIAPSYSSRYPFIFTFSGAAQTEPQSTGSALAALNKSFGEMGPWRSAF